MHEPNQEAVFMVGNLTDSDVANIKFGEEGQRWEFWKVETFLNSDQVVPKLKDRLKRYLLQKHN